MGPFFRAQRARTKTCTLRLCCCYCDLDKLCPDLFEEILHSDDTVLPRERHTEGREGKTKDCLTMVGSQQISDIKREEETFHSAYVTFLGTASQSVHNVISGIQYHYDCKNTVSEDDLEDGVGGKDQNRWQDQNTNEDKGTRTEEEERENNNYQLTEEDLLSFKESHKNPREEVHGQLAVCIGQLKNVFTVKEKRLHCSQGSVSFAQGNDYQEMYSWQTKTKDRSQCRQKDSISICLLRDLDEKLLTSHPAEFLRLEDQQLVELDKKTENWWNEVNRGCR